MRVRVRYIHTMANIQTINFSEARTNLKYVFDAVIEEEKVYIVTTLYKRSVVIISVPEYNGLMETVHVLSSSRNATRLREAMVDATAGRLEARPAGDWERVVRLTQSAIEDRRWWESTDPRMAARLELMLDDLARRPRAYLIERTVPLGRDLAGHRTMVVQGEHRLVFRMADEDVIVIQCRYYS